MRHLIEQLHLPTDACSYLCDLWDVIQFFDDVADDDPVERSELDKVLWSVLVGMPNNNFYTANSHTLLPIVATQILKWQASDISERDGKVNEKTFMWRAGYYDVVLMVCFLCFGRKVTTEAAVGILSIYGEKYTDYKKEFKNA